MAEKTLNAWVVLGGKVDNSFTAMGQSLVTLGGAIDGISQKLINFGKESIQTYRSYEDSMLEAQVALSTNYGRGTKALGEVMSQLDAQASEWAATTIFHTDDVASAIAEAAHANWDLEQILEGMPAAMRLAQAGSLDLSTGLDYIIKSTNAAGIEFGDLMEWVDEWTYAANSSAGDVEQFGEAMLRMGSTMKFADSKEELLTLLAVLHDSGATGANAGTLLRNTMIRLIAPTKKASDAMEELGVSEAEVEEAMGEVDGDVAEAMKRLEEMGFSAYDTKGNLKDFTEIFEDLNAATQGMTDDEKYKIWSAIFPTRTITGGIALIEAADKSWNGLLDDLKGGEASGYGDYAAETMMSGLTGSIETFNSKVEDLKKLLGANMSGQLETILGNFGELIDKIRAGGTDNGVSAGLDWLEGISGAVGDLAGNLDEMDPALFDALVAGLGGIASLGPMLLVGGAAIRGIGWALSIFTGSVVGNVILAAAGLAVIMTALNKYSEAKYMEKFGEMNIDTTQLDASMARIGEAFNKAKEPAEGFAKALDDSVTNYNTAAQTFSATMMEDLLADQTLTGDKLEAKLAEYRTLGKQMVGALKEGITASGDFSAEFWAMVIKGQNGTDEELEKNELYSGILQALNDEKSDALRQAEAIGNKLQAAITSAWEDGHLSEEEREKIKQYFLELNEAMAEAQREAQSREDFVKRRQMMDKAQGMMDKAQDMSYSQMRDYVQSTINPQRQAELDWLDENYQAQIYGMEYDRDKAQQKYNELMSQGRFEEAQKYGQRVSLYNRNIEGAKGAYEQARSGIYSNYDELMLTWFTATLADSEMNGGIPALRQAAAWLTGGQETNQHVLHDYLRNNGADIGGLEEYYQTELAALGGVDEIKRRIAAYEESGDESLMAMADGLKEILAIYSILNTNNRDFEEYETQRNMSATDWEAMYRGGAFGRMGENYLKMLLDEDYDSLFMQGEHDKLDAVTQGYVDALSEAFGQMYDTDMINQLFGEGRELDPALRDDFAAAVLLGMSPEERERYRRGSAEQERYTTQNAMEAARQAQAAAQKAYEEQYNLVYQNGKMGGSAEAQRKLADLKADLDLKNQALAEAQAAREAVEQQFAEPIQAEVQINLNTGGFFGWVGGLLGNLGLPKQATGGRSTKPSIFAEAGKPEWFIPEEHTQNTGQLLLAAAMNSGFSLTELAAMGGARLFARGGTNGNGSLDWGSIGAGSGSGGGINIQYAPVINAQNADGVEEKLVADKARFRDVIREMLAERDLYRSLTAYA